MIQLASLWSESTEHSALTVLVTKNQRFFEHSFEVASSMG
jgi:hypothetical protein